MYHEKIIRREDGSRVKIWVSFTCDSWGRKPEWSFGCQRCERGKRTWKSPVEISSYTIKRLRGEERDNAIRQAYLTLASEAEVLEVMNELLASIKPVV